MPCDDTPKMLASVSKRIIGPILICTGPLISMQEFLRLKKFLPKRSNCIDTKMPKLDIVVSSITMHLSFEYLKSRPEELFHYMAGMQLGKKIVLEQIIKVKPAYQSIGGWKGDSKDSLDKLLSLDKFGHFLGCTVHMHPGFGRSACLPSSVDKRYQEGLEKAKYLAIMGIFSRDGYFRFLRFSGDFEIKILGRGVTTIDGKARLFHISDSRGDDLQGSKDQEQTGHFSI
jgi:hypothetical protein